MNAKDIEFSKFILDSVGSFDPSFTNFAKLKRYKPRYFRIEEFLPPDVYDDYGQFGFEILIDPRISWTMDALRILFDAPITVNDYYRGGKHTQRGFRNRPVDNGATLSQHCFGRACDFTIMDIDSNVFRQLVKVSAPDSALKSALRFITRIEDGVSWVHIDCAGIKSETGIIFFNKK